jgi:hypothetical protein
MAEQASRQSLKLVAAAVAGALATIAFPPALLVAFASGKGGGIAALILGGTLSSLTCTWLVDRLKPSDPYAP